MDVPANLPTPQVSPRLNPFDSQDELVVPAPDSTRSSPATIAPGMGETTGTTFLSSNEDVGSVESTIQSFTPDGKIVYSSNFGGDFKTFKYDAVAGPTVKQNDLYSSNVKPIIDGVWEGYHGTVLAYGQTGSGKTYTMRGPEGASYTGDIPNDAGLIPRALKDLFDRAEGTDGENGDASFTISYLQIYCEMLHDMLGGEGEGGAPPLSIREKGGRVYVENLTSVPVKCVEEGLSVLQAGDAKRATASTLLNAHSSRSHAAMIFTVHRRQDKSKKVTVSNLVMVDLAGSERAKRSGAQFQQFEELKAINLSLSALGNCVSALAAGRNHVPFRDSKLTRLLQNSIGGTCGNSRTTLVVCTRPGADDGGETYSSLMFAHRASAVKVVAKLNEVVDYEKLYKDLISKKDNHEDEIHKLELEIAQLKTDLEKTTLKEESSSQQRDALSKRLASVEKGFQASLEAVGVVKGGDEGDTDIVGAIEAVSEKWQCEIESLQQEHARELETAKVKYDQKISAYRAAANSANFDQENVDHALEKERENHLDTLTNLKAVSDKLKENEKENSNRIAELLAELNEKNAIIEEHDAAMKTKENTHNKKISDLVDRLGELEVSSKERMTNMVSRESVLEMETLFSETIDKLVGRVNQLEASAKENKIMGEITNVGKKLEKSRDSNMDNQSRMLLEQMESNLNPYGIGAVGSNGAGRQMAPGGKVRVRKQAF